LEKTQIWLRWLRQGQENGSIWFSSYSENWCQQQEYTSINFISNTRTLFADYQRN
jgi:hypothetical protein